MNEEPVIMGGQRPVISVDDITGLDFAPHRRPGCERAQLHQDSTAQTAVFRVAPGSGVPIHLHSRANDFFVGVQGLLEIRYEGQHGNGIFKLKPGGFLALPPGVRHEVFNPSTTDIAFFLLSHTPHDGFDFLEREFKQLQPALDY